MEGEIINDRYKAIRELKVPRDGKIYYVVEDTQNGNELKMLKGIGLFNEQQETDAKSEVLLLQKLDNDYVVKLLDDFTFIGPKSLKYHALILEYLPGGDLSEYLKEKLLNEGKETEEPWDENEALRITAQLAVALDYVHNHNVIHRDVKPENVLLSADKKTAKLADFNISRVIEATKNTGVAGTMDYYPPETFKNQNTEQVSFGRDLWSFGIVMQMLCTFRHPFAGDNHFQTMMNITQNIRQPAQVIFPAMESLIRQCLVVEIGERVESVSALIRHPVLLSLVEQLKNRIRPENLTFGLDRLGTKDVINSHLMKEMQSKIDETQRKMLVYMESLKEAQDEISGLKEKVKILEMRTPLAGFGHYYCNDANSVRKSHDENAVRKVLKAIEGGLTDFNLKFNSNENLKISEGKWTVRHQSCAEKCGGDGFSKLWLLHNGNSVDFEADADDIGYYSGNRENSAKKLRPDQDGMVRIKGEKGFVRWNIKLKK